MSDLRNQFIKETGLKIETEHKHDCEQCADEVLFDTWNDEYIFWLEKKLANEADKSTDKALILSGVRLNEVALCDCFKDNKENMITGMYCKKHKTFFAIEHNEA